MRQGAGYNDEARRDAMTRRHDNSTTTRREGRETRHSKRRGMAMRQDGHDDKGQRDDATTNQKSKQTDERTKKAGAT